MPLREFIQRSAQEGGDAKEEEEEEEERRRGGEEERRRGGKTRITGITDQFSEGEGHPARYSTTDI